MVPIIWLTGLTSSGKSTIAVELDRRLRELGKPSSILDADALRHILWPELGFSQYDRTKNVERLGYVARLMARANVFSIVAAISPSAKDRLSVRRSWPDFVEVHLRCPLPLLRARDTNRVYARFNAGVIRCVAGLDYPYDEPENPEVVIDTDIESIASSVDRIIDALTKWIQ